MGTLTDAPVTVDTPGVTTVGPEANCPVLDVVDAATGVPTVPLNTGADDVVTVPVPSPTTMGCALVFPCTLLEVFTD